MARCHWLRSYLALRHNITRRNSFASRKKTMLDDDCRREVFSYYVSIRAPWSVGVPKRYYCHHYQRLKNNGRERTHWASIDKNLHQTQRQQRVFKVHCWWRGCFATAVVDCDDSVASLVAANPHAAQTSDSLSRFTLALPQSYKRQTEGAFTGGRKKGQKNHCAVLKSRGTKEGTCASGGK